MGIKEEITKIAVEQGYEGAKPKSIAQAIDALTDTLAGEDVSSGRSVVDAIRKYAPYVGSGGGSIGQGYYVSNLSVPAVVYATRPDDLSTPPNIMFTPRDVSSPSILPAGVYVCILDNGENSIKVIAVASELELETETRESPGGTLCCFVMPDETVSIRYV